MSTVEFTEEQLTSAEPNRVCIGVAPFDPAKIAQGIAAKYGTSWTAMQSKSRYAHFVAARRELYFTLRAHGWSYPAIGAFVGGRDHTTVMSAVKGTSELAKARKKLLWATREAAKGAA